MTSGAKRLFLALWPDPAVRKRLAVTQNSLARNPRLHDAKPVRTENFHLTLHFLGDVTEASITKLEFCLANVHATPFYLTIDRWGYFPKARICWVGATTVPEALSSLLEQTAVCAAGAVENYRQPRFTPHITLFRKARHPLKIEPPDHYEWKLDRFALVASLTRPEGVEYTVLREWMF